MLILLEFCPEHWTTTTQLEPLNGIIQLSEKFGAIFECSVSIYFRNIITKNFKFVGELKITILKSASARDRSFGKEPGKKPGETESYGRYFVQTSKSNYK
jgi:hypothetical protein